MKDREKTMPAGYTTEHIAMPKTTEEFHEYLREQLAFIREIGSRDTFAAAVLLVAQIMLEDYPKGGGFKKMIFFEFIRQDLMAVYDEPTASFQYVPVTKAARSIFGRKPFFESDLSLRSELDSLRRQRNP